MVVEAEAEAEVGQYRGEADMVEVLVALVTEGVTLVPLWELYLA